NRTMIEAARRGVYDFLWKPIDVVRLRELVRGALAHAVARNEPEISRVDCVTAAEVLLGRSTAMQALYKEIGRAAQGDVAVLLIGETGAGKSLTARTIHRHGHRRQERFATVDPSGMTVERLEHELFGYERGAFVGAAARRIGWLERSSGGTLLLKQVEQLPPRVQGQLVGLFEEQTIRRIGGGSPVAADVRIVASTPRELEPLVAAGRFRADLYYHLESFAIRVPPLRERLADLAELVDHFWRRLTQHRNDGHSEFGQELLDALAEYRWPGNLWELQSVVYQIFWRSRGQTPWREALPEPLQPTRSTVVSGAGSPPVALASVDELISTAAQGGGDLYAACVALFDRYLCSRVLEHTGGNQSRAARILGMTRRSLRTKIRRWSEPTNDARPAKPRPAAKKTARRASR
ncbi:MAG TPA: sigma-54 dependent transcriptional regulator, partial [Pirellulales bacterium]|nr:sigma-54 dependent transcriptional regulator [Pirellulales bacterium]